ncbi:epoxyqueuosine reductase [Halanaerobium salsuginis]|uniref:Epoxyqueuosine reductase n=1 Tax=Halanaerobium salsuginis TaxID=29563 RepID=A0A1I4EM68_9FIRM|nr:epoxyqueuosine reductase [Halanaerobium salsuginis]
MLKNKIIKNVAYQNGLDICRITDGNELIAAREKLQARAETEYWPQPLANQNITELTTPSLFLTNLKSIIVLGVNYYNQGVFNQKLSSYITAVDYHNYLQNKLEKLVEQLKLKFNFDFSYKIFVDTAPFLEREVARKAGVGFIGKNTMLINPQYGSYLFLAEILTDLEIEIDYPLTNNCGSCQICLNNCEGGALKEEYLLAGKDCISYLTQKKGMLTEAARKKIGTHFWGCDICQQKCPYNQQLSYNKQAELQFFAKDLSYFLELERNNLPAELEKTALSWRGARILQRNALIVAANLQEEKYFELIRKYLTDNSPIIRCYAVWALSKLDYARSVDLLQKQLVKENDRLVKKEIKAILFNGGDRINEYSN